MDIVTWISDILERERAEPTLSENWLRQSIQELRERSASMREHYDKTPPPGAEPVQQLLLEMLGNHDLVVKRLEDYLRDPQLEHLEGAREAAFLVRDIRKQLDGELDQASTLDGSATSY